MSALAAQLYARHWYDWDWWDVRNRIVNTRKADQGYFAGLVDYYAALEEW